MKIQLAVYTILLLSASSAMAFPAANLRSLVNKNDQVNCQRRTPNSDFRDLIVKASYMGDDDREEISKNLDVVGFSREEEQQAMACTGSIICPGRESRQQSAGAVCAPNQRSSDGKCAADRLSTSGHMFVDKKTNRFFSNNDSCEFFNYKGHRSKLIVEDIKSIDPRQDHLNPHKNVRADKLVIRLKDPIPNCDPYDLKSSPVPVLPGEKVVVVSHVQVDMDQRFSGNEPLAYPCEIQKTFKPKNGGPSVHYSNCDLNGIGSGAFGLTRRASDNKLEVAALFIRTGERSKNGRAYNVDDDNFTVSIGTEEDFIRLAQRPGERLDPQVTQGEGSRPPLQPASN